MDSEESASEDEEYQDLVEEVTTLSEEWTRKESRLLGLKQMMGLLSLAVRAKNMPQSVDINHSFRLFPSSPDSPVDDHNCELKLKVDSPLLTKTFAERGSINVRVSSEHWPEDRKVMVNEVFPLNRAEGCLVRMRVDPEGVLKPPLLVSVLLELKLDAGGQGLAADVPVGCDPVVIALKSFKISALNLFNSKRTPKNVLQRTVGQMTASQSLSEPESKQTFTIIVNKDRVGEITGNKEVDIEQENDLSRDLLSHLLGDPDIVNSAADTSKSGITSINLFYFNEPVTLKVRPAAMSGTCLQLTVVANNCQVLTAIRTSIIEAINEKPRNCSIVKLNLSADCEQRSQKYLKELTVSTSFENMVHLYQLVRSNISEKLPLH